MLALYMLLAAAAAQEKAATKPDEQIVVVGERPEDRKRVCRETEQVGSIIPRRVCRTKGEWASIARDTERRSRAYINDKNSMSGRVGSDEKGKL